MSSKPSDQNEKSDQYFKTPPRGLVRQNRDVSIGLVNIELSGDLDEKMKS